MPRKPGSMERIQQPIWDTLIQGTPGNFQPRTSVASGPYTLFTGGQANSVSVTNMDTSGVLPGNQTYLLLAMRVNLYFRGCAPAAQRDVVMYHHAQLCLYWELKIDEKRYFIAPSWYLNAGGGLDGDLGTSTDVMLTNGSPGADSIMTLDRPIPLVKQQPFQVNATVSAVGTANLGTDIDALTSGEVNIQFVLDGLKLRDVL